MHFMIISKKELTILFDNCLFIAACMNYHKDCAAYASAPYNYCTFDQYSPWMEWKCAKACNYCNQSK